MVCVVQVGAYQACGVQAPGTGEFKAVVAADTLFPEAAGQPLRQEDQDFIWHVSGCLCTAQNTGVLLQLHGIPAAPVTKHPSMKCTHNRMNLAWWMRP